LSSPLHNVRELISTRVEAWVDRSTTQLLQGMRWAREEGEHRLRLRTLQRDLDYFWIRLGKTAYRLAESGEIEHVGLERTMERIQALQEEIRTLRESSGTPQSPER
jgi:hypothetical protein